MRKEDLESSLKKSDAKNAPAILMEFLQLSSEGLLTKTKVGEFINFCLSLLETYFHFNHEPIIKFLFANGLTIKDISIECLSSFFRFNEQNQPILITNFLSKLNKPLNEYPAILIYRRFYGYLQHSADFYLLYLEKEYDRQSYLMRRKLKSYITNSEMLYLKKELQGETVYPLNYDPLLELPLLTNEEMISTFERLRFIQGKKKIILFLYDTLSSITDARRAVPLSTLIQILKFNNSVEYDIEDFADPALPDTSLIDIGQAMYLIDKMLSEKLLKNYINKGMSAEHAEAVKKSCLDIIIDLLNCGEHDNYYLYFSRYSTISKERFESDLRRKFDYLIRLSREILADCTSDENYDK